MGELNKKCEACGADIPDNFQNLLCSECYEKVTNGEIETAPPVKQAPTIAKSDKDNVSADLSWLERSLKRFREIGVIIPARQRKLYESLRDHMVSGKTVVDLGSSIGVGSNLLSHTARHVWGVDINKESVQFANLAFARDNLSFDLYDLENPPSRGISDFEIVVCSEVIEHLQDVEKGMETLKSFFSSRLSTVGFITIPNINNEDVKKRDDDNRLHLHRWNAGQFYEFLNNHFNTVTLFDVDKLDQWTKEETIDGNSTAPLIVARVEGVKG